MNRELKFRAWNPEQSKFEYFELHNITVPDRLLVQEKYPVQQFTGMVDKNGKEIYEGDIIKYWVPHFDERVPRIDDVRFVSGCFIPDIWRTTVDDCEVVGNIFETHQSFWK